MLLFEHSLVLLSWILLISGAVLFCICSYLQYYHRKNMKYVDKIIYQSNGSKPMYRFYELCAIMFLSGIVLIAYYFM